MEIFFIFLKNWWWFILTIFFFFSARFLYFWWVRWEFWYKKNERILLEIKPPAENLKPLKAMEDIFNQLWGIYDSPNWRERWCEGELPKFPFWLSFEIVSLGGQIHFYCWINKEWRDMIEAAICAQYPQAEISVVEDYTKNVPQDIPNEKWDLYGEDYTFLRDDSYPIKTYAMFFEKPEEEKRVMEEKRLDPIDSLLEMLSQLLSGEQFWFQICINPITNRDIPWIDRGRALANKIAKRPPAKKAKPFWQKVLDNLLPSLVSPAKVTPTERELIAPELRMTPGERLILSGVENKIEKYGFKCWIRIVHLYKKDEPHNRGNFKIARTYFNQFATIDMNSLVYLGPTRTKINYFFKEKRLFLRKRKQFRSYCQRLPSYYPWNLEGFPVHPFDFGFYPKGPGIGRGTIVLNSEELASLYHFPTKIILPTVQRVEAKRGGPPPGLPIG